MHKHMTNCNISFGTSSASPKASITIPKNSHGMDQAKAQAMHLHDGWLWAIQLSVPTTAKRICVCLPPWWMTRNHAKCGNFHWQLLSNSSPGWLGDAPWFAYFYAGKHRSLEWPYHSNRWGPKPIQGLYLYLHVDLWWWWCTELGGAWQNGFQSYHFADSNWQTYTSATDPNILCCATIRSLYNHGWQHGSWRTVLPKEMQQICTDYQMLPTHTWWCNDGLQVFLCSLCFVPLPSNFHSCRLPLSAPALSDTGFSQCNELQLTYPASSCLCLYRVWQPRLLWFHGRTRNSSGFTTLEALPQWYNLGRTTGGYDQYLPAMRRYWQTHSGRHLTPSTQWRLLAELYLCFLAWNQRIYISRECLDCPMFTTRWQPHHGGLLGQWLFHSTRDPYIELHLIILMGYNSFQCHRPWRYISPALSFNRFTGGWWPTHIMEHCEVYSHLAQSNSSW